MYTEPTTNKEIIDAIQKENPKEELTKLIEEKSLSSLSPL